MVEEEARRKSQPQVYPTETDPQRIAELEAENGLRQFDYVRDRIREALNSEKEFRLRPSDIQTLNRLAVEGLDNLPGSFRPGDMTISHSNHVPPSGREVARHVDDMCDYINNNWDTSAWHLAAYAMWRLNWIHPFQDGNGRTSRALSYLILCVKLGVELPGRKAIPDLISERKTPYYKALDDADEKAKQNKIDVSKLESFLQDALAEQLATWHRELEQNRDRWTHRSREFCSTFNVLERDSRRR